MPDLDYQPDAAYFDTMARHARTHWWYEGRRSLVRETLRRFEIPDGLVLDVGCGTGDNMEMLAEVAGVAVVGTDLSAHALRHAVRGRTEIALAEDLPVASGRAARREHGRRRAPR